MKNDWFKIVFNDREADAPARNEFIRAFCESYDDSRHARGFILLTPRNPAEADRVFYMPSLVDQYLGPEIVRHGGVRCDQPALRKMRIRDGDETAFNSI